MADLPTNGATAFDLNLGDDALGIVLLVAEGKISAYHNACPHAGRRLDWAPGRFLIENDLLVCAAHGACFRMTDGCCVSGPCKGESLQKIAVIIEHDDIFLEKQ